MLFRSIALGLVRSGELYRIDSPEAETVEPGDRLLFIRHVTGEDVKSVSADRPRG